MVLSVLLLVLLYSCNDGSVGLDSGKPPADGRMDTRPDTDRPDRGSMLDKVLLPDKGPLLEKGPVPDTGPPSGTAWVFTSGGGGDVYEPSVATDKGGNTYVSGRLGGVVKFGTATAGTTGK